MTAVLPDRRHAAPAGPTLTGPTPTSPTPTSPARTMTGLHRRRPARTLWRTVVVAYAAVLVALLVDVKIGFVQHLTASPLLIGYGLCVSAYLLTRMVLALGYRPDRTRTPEAVLPSVTVVVPAFNEGAHVRATLDAMFALDYPSDRLSVVVVDDGSDDTTWERIVEAGDVHPALDAIRFSRNRGKRAAMAAGVRAAGNADYVVFVDSDSVLAPDALREIVRPFLGPNGARVGGVTGHAYLQNPGTNLLTRLQQVRYFSAFRVVKAAESRFGVVSCASGCFSVYRRTDLLDLLPAWESQTFLGCEATFGDDRALTNMILRSGREVRYQSTAHSFTLAPDSWRVFFRQQLRWKKSWTRESIAVARFAWRWNPLASAAMYASILLQLVGPLVAVHALVWRPLVGGVDPWLYLLGLHAMAVLYGLLYAYVQRSPHWWGGIVFAFVYTAVLGLQTYWAAVTARNNTWGTRSSRYDDTGELAVAAIVGAPGPCGLPVRLESAAPSVTWTSAQSTACTTASPIPTEDTAPTRRDWMVGVAAIPLSAAPIGLLMLMLD